MSIRSADTETRTSPKHAPLRIRASERKCLHPTRQLVAGRYWPVRPGASRHVTLHQPQAAQARGHSPGPEGRTPTRHHTKQDPAIRTDRELAAPAIAPRSRGNITRASAHHANYQFQIISLFAIRQIQFTSGSRGHLSHDIQ